jgi:hypothetical protein
MTYPKGCEGVCAIRQYPPARIKGGKRPGLFKRNIERNGLFHLTPSYFKMSNQRVNRHRIGSDKGDSSIRPDKSQFGTPLILRNGCLDVQIWNLLTLLTHRAQSSEGF